jgi:septal ring factor EnvC (AmiA/AmiB activator)
MTHFQRWVPEAYMTSMTYLRRPPSRPGTVLPWLFAVIASVTLTAVLLTHVAGGTVVAANSAPTAGGVTTQPGSGAAQREQLLLEERIARLTKIVDQLSAKFDDASQNKTAADTLHRQLASLSSTAEALKHELAGVSKHAMQVESSISNIDVNVSTPEVLSNKLERQKKGASRP